MAVWFTGNISFVHWSSRQLGFFRQDGTPGSEFAALEFSFRARQKEKQQHLFSPTDKSSAICPPQSHPSV